MNIAIITSRYPSAGNPYNHMFVHIRSKEFTRQGMQVEVFVPCKENADYIFEGIKVKTMPSKQIIKYLQEYDILYLHLLNLYPLMKTDGWPVYKSIMQNKYPFAMYVHGSEVSYFKDRFFENTFNLKDVLSWIRKDFYQMPKLTRFFNSINMMSIAIIIPSKWMRDKIKMDFKIKNICVIPNGIDVELFSFRKINIGTKLISIRPLSDKVYDIETTIEVMTLLPDQYTLDIFGRGKYKDHYQRLVVEKNLAKRVKIIDKFIDRNKMNQLFHQYNVFISTTKLDTQGITMLEAMSSGLLVASTDNSSKKEFIDDMKTGILGVNAMELSEKILEVTSNKGLFENITKCGRKSMEDICLKVMATNELEILNECIEIDKLS